MAEMERYKIKHKIEMLMFGYWRLLPEPKKSYVMWFHGGAKDNLNEIYEDAEKAEDHLRVV